MNSEWLFGPPTVVWKGAVYVGDWHCGPEAYAATLRAFPVDANGNHSNALEYTVHCNGG